MCPEQTYITPKSDPRLRRLPERVGQTAYALGLSGYLKEFVGLAGEEHPEPVRRRY